MNLKRALPAIAVFLLAFAVYAKTLGHELVWDDIFLRTQIREISREQGVLGVVSAEFRLKPLQPTGYYRPIVLFSLWLDARVERLLPSVYHLENVLWHALNSVLVLLLLRRLLSSTAGSLFGAALFALHPVHTESVAFVSGRTDLQATCFLLTSVIVWLRARTETGARRRVGLMLSVTAFLFAALAKETVFALPAVALAWLLIEPAPGTDRRTVRTASDGVWLLGLGAAAGLVLALRWRLGIPFGPGAAGFFTFPAIQQKAAMLAEYGRLLVLPWPLRAWYTPDQVRLSLPNVLCAAALIAAGLCGRGAARRIGAMSLLWLAGFLLPVLGFVTLGSSIIAERYLYLPSVGFCLLCGLWIGRIASVPRFRVVVAGSTGLVLLACLAATVSQAQTWKDEFAFYRNLVRASPAYAEGHVGLGIALAKQGDPAGAIAEFTTALALDPRSENAHNNLGNVLADSGQPGAAIEHYRQAARINPDSAEIYYNLGRLYAEQGRSQESIASYRQSLRINPNDPEALNNLAWQLVQAVGSSESDAAEAIGYARRANELTGGRDPAILDTLAAAYAAGRRFDQLKHRALPRR